MAGHAAILLLHEQVDGAPLPRVFYGIAEQVQEYLVQPELVAQDALVAHVLDLQGEGLVPGAGRGLDDVPELPQDDGQFLRLFLQLDLAALDIAHVQDVIDEADEVVAGSEDLPQIAFHLLLPVKMGERQRRVAHHRVHGRADVVGHVGEEEALGRTGLLGLFQGLGEQAFLLHLLADARVHALKAHHDARSIALRADTHGLELEIQAAPAVERPVIEIGDLPPRQAGPEPLHGTGLAEGLAVIGVDAGADIGSHLFRKRQRGGKDPLQLPVGRIHELEHPALTRRRVENVHKLVIDAQGAHQLLLAAVLLVLLPLFGKFLRRAVQQEALADELAILFHQLGIAHHMNDLAVRMDDPVFVTGAVAHLLQLADGGTELGFVLLGDGARHHLEAARLQLLAGGEVQKLERGPVDADDAAAVQGMAEDAAVHGGEDGFQSGIVLEEPLLVETFLGHVHANAHGAHHGAIHIAQRGLVDREQPRARARVDGLFGNMRLAAFHDDAFRLDTGRVIRFHIPDIGMPPALHLPPRLAHGAAEAVVDQLVDTVPGLEPDEVGGGGQGAFEELRRLPQILALPETLLPAREVEAQFGILHGQAPDVRGPRQHGCGQGHAGAREHQQFRPPCVRKGGKAGGIKIGPGHDDIGFLRHLAREHMPKAGQGRNGAQKSGHMLRAARNTEPDGAFIHGCVPFLRFRPPPRNFRKTTDRRPSRRNGRRARPGPVCNGRNGALSGKRQFHHTGICRSLEARRPSGWKKPLLPLR